MSHFKIHVGKKVDIHIYQKKIVLYFTFFICRCIEKRVKCTFYNTPVHVTMATSVLDVKTGLLSPDVFSLLESQEIQVCDGIKTLIQENLSSSKSASSVLVVITTCYIYMNVSKTDVPYNYCNLCGGKRCPSG